MDPIGSKPGSESQDSNSPVPTVSFSLEKKNRLQSTSSVGSPLSSPNIAPTAKGVENAKKRLRAFSIQKKTPITPVPLAKPVTTSAGTVIIGKLSGVKPLAKQEDAVDPKKPPKPPKPGSNRKSLQEYMDQQKKTLSEIEDMKWKMELVELGIPLGLICPSSSSDTAMPTKAMPPIKSFLNPEKLNQIIAEAKKAKAEGKAFKFDYQKLLPGYDNPFQRKREEQEKEKKPEHVKRKDDKYDRKTSHRRDDKDRHRGGRQKHKDEIKSKNKEGKIKHEGRKTTTKEVTEKDSKETDVNLSDYLVCDSWSLETDDKNSTSSPKVEERTRIRDIPLPPDKPGDHIPQLKDSFIKNTPTPSPTSNTIKVQKLKPVIDSFEYEIDPNDDEMLDIFDEDPSLEKYSSTRRKMDNIYDSPVELKLYDELSIKDVSMDASSDEKFLQSVINEIKQGDLMDEESQDKGLVEYDMSPPRDDQNSSRDSVTPELKDLNLSQRSDYSDGYKSIESGYKSTESGYKSNESSYKSSDMGCKSNVSMDSERSLQVSMEKDIDDMEEKFSKTTVDSLETWNFVLKICQPLLFRHDKNKCYKETRSSPKIWYTENPKRCNCVKDRSVVYDELEMFKMTLVDRVYGCDQIPDPDPPNNRTWYLRSSQSMVEKTNIPIAPDDDWEGDDSQAECKPDRRSMTPQRNEEIYLDREYQRFMQAVLSDVTEKKSETPRSTTPVTSEIKTKDDGDDKKKAKKPRLSSEGWSQESEVDEEEAEKSRKKLKLDKEKEKSRKRKHSSSISDSDGQSVKKKRSIKKKTSRKSSKHNLSKKYMKKLKLKKKNKLLKLDKSEDDSVTSDEKERKKKEKKAKKKRQQKLKRKNQKKKKSKAKSSSSSSTSSTSSSSSSDSSTDESEKRRKKKKEMRRKKRKQSSSESGQSEELFDVNILNNIKTEKVTDDEKQVISPRKMPREIINVKELQNDFVGNNIHIKKEQDEEKKDEIIVPIKELQKESPPPADESVDNSDGSVEAPTTDAPNKIEETFKEPQDPSRSTPQLKTITEESNHSQSSQESVVSIESKSKDRTFEKDESHLRALSPNSNYSFNDVIAASGTSLKEQEEKFGVNFEQGNYEMYEQMALSYSSEVASQDAAQIPLPPPQEPSPVEEMSEVTEVGPSIGDMSEMEVCVAQAEGGSQRIETVVRARCRGEIKCDWRPTDLPNTDQGHRERPSRWGLKPGEVNIVLTGGHNNEQFPIQTVVDSQPVYKIQSLANRSDSCSIGYDEAYMDTYGALDRLQYGDCFGEESPHTREDTLQHELQHELSHEQTHEHEHEHEREEQHHVQHASSTLDERITRVLHDTVLGEVAKDDEETDTDKDGPDKGILITKPTACEMRANKRVSFADGYKPGQDSDIEEPPLKKRKKPRRVGCAWPCPAAHPDHVPLWDALPPPPPPPGSPPPAPHAPHALLLRHKPPLLPTPTHMYNPNGPIPGFMPEPQPGIIF